MNGACHPPSSSTTWGIVGGAYSRSLNLASGACGERNGAPAADATTMTRNVKPRRRMSAGLDCARIDEDERHVGHDRADREEDRAGGRATGDQIEIARAERVEHQDAESGPGRDGLDGKRSAEQRADDQAINRRRRA